MEVCNSFSDFNCDKHTVVTLGTFDGVHLGHRFILNRVINAAKDSGMQSLVLTFFPHPRMILQQNETIKLLNTITEKAELLEQLGLDHLIIQKFDTEFAQLTAEDFVKKVLVDTFKIKKIIIGYDHRFGKNRAADINDLILFGEKYDFEVEQISAQEIDDVSISSTKIRTALSKGQIKLANDYLGYSYFLNGTVVHGKKLGRTIGYPTANIQVSEDYKLIPAIGVYAVSVLIDANVYFGMLSVGTNPTLGINPITIEVNIFDFNDDIYGKEITVAFIEKIRDEAIFASLDELKEALASDKKRTLEIIEL